MRYQDCVLLNFEIYILIVQNLKIVSKQNFYSDIQYYV